MPQNTIPQITIHNAETGEVITRDANAEELAQIQIDSAAKLTEQAEAEAKATARAAILDRLGLTAEEAALLLS
jgi:hypothetical protein